jgi:PAS domain S-box-containing protein
VTSPKPGALRPPSERPIPIWLLVAWALTGILLAILAGVSIRRGEKATRSEWESRLARLADDRLAIAERAMHGWRHEADLLGRLESVRELVGRRGEGSAAVRAQRSSRGRAALDDLVREEPGMEIGVVDGEGRLSAASAGASWGHPALLEPARRALAGNRTVVAHPIREGSDALMLAIAEPILEDSGRAKGAVLVAVDAADAFGRHFPRAGESSHERLFVVVPEADQYLLVAPEWRGEAGASYRVPASDRSTFAAAAMESPRGAGEFSDGRGRRIIAASRRIPELGWAVVVGVDGRRALASRRSQTLWVLLGAAALWAATLGFGLAWHRSLGLRHYRDLAERDARYRSLLDQTQEAVAVAVEGKVTYANPACIAMFALEKPLPGVPIGDFFAPGSREQVEEIVRDRLAGRPAPELYEAVGLRGDGATFDVELRVTPLDFEGRPAHQAILRDITVRKRMEDGLRESEERYRLLFERSLSGVYRSTVDGRLLECNRAFAQMMGYASPAEAMSQPAAGFHASLQARQDFIARLRREGSLVAYENQGRRKDGSTIWVIENVSLLGSEEDGDETLLGTVFDMTERRRLEEQLLQAQKMEAIGRLAGGIAHDFNNLLTAVAGYTELLLAQLPEGDVRREHAEEIRLAGTRAAALTQQLLAFSRRQVLEPRVLDLNTVIADMERMLRRVIGEDIELTASLDPGLWRTKADPGQIEQSILNLVVNARDAMPRGGRLTIETGNVEVDETFAGRYVTVHAGPHVMLAVSDTGIGMNADLQARLFEPFFTTKERGKGTGLGLSTTYGIVKQSGGSIWVYSEPGHGSTFKIYLPRCEEPLDVKEPAPSAATPLTGSETILLVEDEPEVRRLAEKLLRMRGYEVIAAGSPAEAIALTRHREASIAILVTDVIMPGMNGRELARALAPSRPRMRVLYMSGYTDAAITQQGILDPGTAFLAKPFTPDALARKVREVLDAPEAT